MHDFRSATTLNPNHNMQFGAIWPWNTTIRHVQKRRIIPSSLELYAHFSVHTNTVQYRVTRVHINNDVTCIYNDDVTIVTYHWHFPRMCLQRFSLSISDHAPPWGSRWMLLQLWLVEASGIDRSKSLLGLALAGDGAEEALLSRRLCSMKPMQGLSL